MFNEVKRMVSGFGVVTNKKLDLVSNYIMGLMVNGTKHSLEVMGKLAECHPSRFSHLLNHSGAVQVADALFGRALRRKLSKLKFKKGQTFILIDATFTRRTSRHVENCGIYHSGSGYVRGHKWLNFLLVHCGQVTPLASLPLYSKSYCTEHGLEYSSEPDRVISWLQKLQSEGLFSSEDFQKIYFLADSGYDTKKIERTILSLGSHFVIALKSSRAIEGCRVSQYFKRYKKGHKAKTIRFGGTGRKTMTFKVRLATNVSLKGVGNINVVCSKGMRGKKETVKYIGCSDQRLKAREIAKYYRIRWKIETWHKEVKQNYGFGDCACHRFSAVHAHVHYVLTAYVIQSELSPKQMSLDELISTKLLKKVRGKLTQIGQVASTQTIINEALRAMAA